jgi:23S rRNA pseudouridine1911/1915/1917 synthase
MVFARTSKSASRLSEQIRHHQFDKRYVAVVEGSGAWKLNEWTETSHYLVKDEQAQRMRTVPENSQAAQLARLRWRMLASTSGLSLVEVELLTGRKHQIRLQFSELGHPILGDKKYGCTRSFINGIALHSHRLGFTHPTKQERMTFESSPLTHWAGIPRTLLDAYQMRLD